MFYITVITLLNKCCKVSWLFGNSMSSLRSKLHSDIRFVATVYWAGNFWEANGCFAHKCDLHDETWLKGICRLRRRYTAVKTVLCCSWAVERCVGYFCCVLGRKAG